MTPKEKAKELVDKFTVVGLQQRAEGYQCALIAVDEILNNSVNYNAYDGVDGNDIWSDNDYWEEVKQEIEKL